MTLSLNEIRQRATEFAREFRDATSERADAQLFWKEFFQVFGINARRVGAFERPTDNLLNASGRGRIDFLWKGKVLVEHKSRGEDLDAAGTQARDYFPGLKDSELPRHIIVSDFARIRLDDLETGDSQEFPLPDLPRRIGLFGFLSGYTTRPPLPTDPVNQQATEALGKLHDLLEEDGYTGRALDVWMVRTLFCLFADSACIFEPGLFRELIERRTAEDGNDLGAWMGRLHKVLDQPTHRRPKSLDESLTGFPYVNGQLFGEPIEEPATNAAMRTALLDACKVDWKSVSPAIFGSLFQSIKDRAERRRGGEHYTTEENILKCLDPLFLDALRAELAAAGKDARKLGAFLARLRRIRVFDPACGCGNFLVVAYRELRRLEQAALRARYGGDDAGTLASLIHSEVNVDQMHGLEVDDWPAQIARVALWLTDHQANMALSDEFGKLELRLPLTTSPRILVGNALREDWAACCPPGADVYCVGNPPFIGAKFMEAPQRLDVKHVFGAAKNAGLLDYVACWYLKAADWMAGDDRAETCFVSTNSITQGEQPAVLWAELWRRGVVVNFAHRTFAWTSEARGKAAVHCVIIGLALRHRAQKRLWEYEQGRGSPREVSAVTAINPYLVDGPMVALPRRSKPLDQVPKLVIGNQPIDGGNLLFNAQEASDYRKLEPNGAKFLKRFLGADEYLYSIDRWTIDLRDASPSLIRELPMAYDRLRKVQQFRVASRRPQTQALAATPSVMGIGIYPIAPYLVVPRHSGEDRKYIPIGFAGPENICGDSNMLMPEAKEIHFAILTSEMHMAWVRGVCGRLESRYRYSTGIVYNNFPWPDPSDAQRKAIETAAQAVLDARSAHPGATLADLYDPLAMPPNLRRAHDALDRVVDAAYGQPRGFPTEAARLAFLFTLYQSRAAPLDAGGGAAKRPAKPRKTRLPKPKATPQPGFLDSES
jgi:hypothetical protein